jgi:hypothetical protein
MLETDSTTMFETWSDIGFDKFNFSLIQFSYSLWMNFQQKASVIEEQKY